MATLSIVLRVALGSNPENLLVILPTAPPSELPPLLPPKILNILENAPPTPFPSEVKIESLEITPPKILGTNLIAKNVAVIFAKTFPAFSKFLASPVLNKCKNDVNLSVKVSIGVPLTLEVILSIKDLTLLLISLQPSINPFLKNSNLYFKSKTDSISGSIPNSFAFKKLSSDKVLSFHASETNLNAPYIFIKPIVTLLQKSSFSFKESSVCDSP